MPGAAPSSWIPTSRFSYKRTCMYIYIYIVYSPIGGGDVAIGWRHPSGVFVNNVIEEKQPTSLGHARTRCALLAHRRRYPDQFAIYIYIYNKSFNNNIIRNCIPIDIVYNDNKIDNEKNLRVNNIISVVLKLLLTLPWTKLIKKFILHKYDKKKRLGIIIVMLIFIYHIINNINTDLMTSVICYYSIIYHIIVS